MRLPPQNASAPPPTPLHEHRITRSDVLAAMALGAVLALLFWAATWWHASPGSGSLPTPVAATVAVETTATPPAAVQVATPGGNQPASPPSTPQLPVAGSGGLLGGVR